MTANHGLKTKGPDGALGREGSTMTMTTTGGPDSSRPIARFAGDYAFLSNFHPSEVVLDGATYAPVEHAFQAAKSADPRQRAAIRQAPSPRLAKGLGRSVELMPGWEARRVGVMRSLLVDKFARHRELKEALLATGERELVEGNHWGDRFWGVCDGAGENRLGRLLMEVRAGLAASGAHNNATGPADEVIVGYDVRLSVHVELARRRIARAVVDPTTAADPTVDADESEGRAMAASGVCDDPSARWPTGEIT